MSKRNYIIHGLRISRLPALVLACASLAAAQNLDVAKNLEGFDEYMAKVLKDWNGPGIGVGIVVGDKLVFAKGYGYRDYEKKLPFTPGTVCPIASNTKLFTAVAAGMLVEEGKLTWDKPVRESVPAVRFYNEQLNNTVTLRDMLSHRTGITRHDTIWYKSDFTRKELFDRLKYLEPQEPMRQTFLYNNLMYAGVGYMIDEKKSYPNACGLRLMIVDGGQGLHRVECCGHTLTLADEKELLTLGFGKLREVEPGEEPDQPPGPAGTA